jgi:hypothetical protein
VHTLSKQPVDAIVLPDLVAVVSHSLRENKAGRLSRYNFKPEPWFTYSVNDL